jgi:tRNA uridine 5-carbamoylmethylation protein Kti12
MTQIPARQITATGGVTGSGKTTVLRLIATCGLPGSGKTTFALKEIEKARLAGDDGVCRANRDALRNAHAGRRLGSARQEAVVTDAQIEMIRSSFQYGYHTVIVDDTNLHGFSRLARLAAELGATFEVKDFRHIPLTTCIMRDKLRPAGERVGEDIIRRMHDEDVLPHLRQVARTVSRTA